MDCLEFNIHHLILSDIASSVGDTKEDLDYVGTLIGSKVQTRSVKPERQQETETTSTIGDITDDIREQDSEGDDAASGDRVFMSASTAHCNIAFGQLLVSFPETHISDTVESIIPVLIDILRDVPYIDFDKCLSWEEWSLPDQLVFSTVSALLRVAGLHPEHAEAATGAIFDFISDIYHKLPTTSALVILTQLSPALHGLYRAISSTSYAWTITQCQKLRDCLASLCCPENIDHLNRLVSDIIIPEGEDFNTQNFVEIFLARYLSRGRPLSGYFIVCCVLETSWTVLAQALVPPGSVTYGNPSEAAAANASWNSLMRQPAVDLEITDEKAIEVLKSTIQYSMQYFNDLLLQIQEMDTEPSSDTYAWETMSESLKLATVCTVALRDVDERLYSRLLLLLSEDSPISDNLVQEAALKATTVLVQNFPDIAYQMSSHLRRFVTAPLSIFEFEFASETRAPPPLAAAAKCLAQCVKLAPEHDLVMSNMYSLLNYIAATSKDVYESSGGSGTNTPFSIGQYPDSLRAVETGLRGLSEDEKRLVGISTISVVTRLALEFQTEEATRLTISMLLQRLRSAEPTVEAAIAYNLVDLALSAPESSFVDIIRVFSVINRSANPDDPRFSNNMVLAAQTRLAQELHRRPELYDLYLVELLTLFADKGVAIQNLKIANHHIKTDDMIEQLASLLLPIDALLSHKDCNPQINTSPVVVALFRNMWFLCVLFHFTSDDDKDAHVMGWKRPAMARIAAKTPAMVVEESQDAVVSDVEYNSVIRQEYAHTVINKHRALLVSHIPLRTSDLRYLSAGQIVFLLTMHDIEILRAGAGLVSSLISYFVNDGLNNHPGLSACMDAIAEKVIRGCIGDLNIQAAQQALPEVLSSELQTLLVCSTHRVERARDVASKFLNRLISAFPSLMCDPPLVFGILEVLTLLRQACENEFSDEYNPIYGFHSSRTGITLQMTDSYKVRNEILAQLHRNANNWFELALGRAPIELQSTLQKYLVVHQSAVGLEGAELGASIAEQFGKAIGPVQRQLVSLSALSGRTLDRSKILASQLASKGYFAGEAAGIRLAGRSGEDKLEQLPPDAAPSYEIKALKAKLTHSLEEIRSKTSTLMVQDLKRLLFRCAATLIAMPECDHELLHCLVALPMEVATPAAVSSGIEAWTWVIAEKGDFEIALLSELLASWSDTIRETKGVFSTSLNYSDPFLSPVGYTPTEREEIDRGILNARRLLSPHALLTQMLLSRLQAARYRRPGIMLLLQQLVLRSVRAHRTMSTHSLARETRFSFLLFGFETLKSSHLDSFCESELREELYAAAYSWFAVRPQWTFGADRVQLNADIKVLTEFLSFLQQDSVRSDSVISSLAPLQMPSRTTHYAARLRQLNQPLKLLVENEIYRLDVWANPTNDPKRGIDQVVTAVDIPWTLFVRTVWQINPAIAIYMCERFKVPTLRAEVSKLVRSNTADVLNVPEALQFLVEDRVEQSMRRDLRLLLLWAPVPPIFAVAFFERRFGNDPMILQYAHRVLEQHPVELTFFYVPQVVQALRYDDLGYVSRFIFETAKISQLFCHQIIWNMKANCYKDDAGEIEDPMKPVLDNMTALVVDSLSGDARAFYDREFDFFHEVTSISGKLKPFIKKTKPEKKAKIDEEMAKIVVDVGVYLPSNPDGKVVDIDKKSGRPLQSHAKAPFMATFKVRKEKVIVNTNPDALVDGPGACTEVRKEHDIWQQAIFKVGDDCRQDVLALQIIAMFKNIFTKVGLMLYLYPYRVTATAPGCGVIDVVPNATSRDEMGRAKVNDLLDFFVAKYGGEDTVAFQKARMNFVQSMAAYSVACYILQIKDRHNGNIMIDGEGHIVHIVCSGDGFLKYLQLLLCRSLRPGGVKFEAHSFKLNHEMVLLMGGRYSQGYQLFQHLTVKAFLAIRPHADQLISMVQLMLDTGFPSFKGDGTIKRLKDRFALGLNERQAADHMMAIIKNAHENVRSTVYDEFQRMQNGIPYK